MPLIGTFARCYIWVAAQQGLPPDAPPGRLKTAFGTSRQPANQSHWLLRKEMACSSCILTPI